jgi:hypothetical protein
MTGKKKTMDGGIFGIIPNQPKYYPESVTNNTFNELYTKLTRNQGFLNKLRSEQRFEHFLKILDYKLSQPNINVDAFIKFYNYFNKISKKYFDTYISKMMERETRIKQYYLSKMQNYTSNDIGLLTSVMEKLEAKKNDFMKKNLIKENTNSEGYNTIQLSNNQHQTLL